jgi:hypothetical protein
MKPSRAVVRLAWVIAALAFVAAGAALFRHDGPGPFSFISARGQNVTLSGRGFYRFDSLFSAAGYRGQDAVTLVLAIPLLLGTVAFYRRGSLRGALLLTGVLAYFLYVYGSMAFSAAYNELFLVYVALLATSFFAFVLAMVSIDVALLQACFTSRIPRRGAAAFLFASGLVTLVVWLAPLVTALAQARPPALLDNATTLVTSALDLAVITPATFVAAGWILRRDPRGYLIAFPLLGLMVMLGPVIALSTASQLSAGVSFARGEVIGPIAGFVLLGTIAVGLMVRLLRNIAEPPASRT